MIKNPFPTRGSYAVTPMLPTDRTLPERKILSMFKHFMLNDFIVDENSPKTKDGFRLAFRHLKQWDIDDGKIEVSHLTTSESQGYGMMMLVYMAGCEDSLGLRPEQWLFGCDRLQDYYDAMLRSVLAFPSVEGNKLYAWQLYGYPREGGNQTGYRENNGYKSAPFSIDPKAASCATDGDMDIIFSLLLADEQWGGGAYDYRQIALDMLKSFWEYCVHPEHYTLLLGDWPPKRPEPLKSATRISDFILGHLKAYARADKRYDWTRVANATYNVIRDLCEDKEVQNGLLPDFAVLENGRWKAPDGTILEEEDGSYFYNACRVPWRLGSDYLLYGDTPIGGGSLLKSVIRPLDEFAKSRNLDLLGPFRLDGTPMMDEGDANVFTAHFLVTAAANAADSDWVDKLWNWHGLDEYNGDNYGDYLKFHSMLTAAGYTWQP